MKSTAATPYPRIMSALFTQPWEMMPEQHAAVCEALIRHLEHDTSTWAGKGEEFRRTGRRENNRFHQEVEISDDGRIAVMPIAGMLGKKLSWLETYCGGTDLAHIDRDIAELQADQRIETVIFDIDSPGGMARPSSDTAHLIAELSETKRTVAYSDGTLASAAYKLAAACDTIYASRSADIGCVGTYIALKDYSEKFKKEGIKLHLFRDGKYKALGYPGKAMTAEEKEFLEEEVQGLSAKFKDFVRQHRKNVDDSALEGQCLSGSKARDTGLIDGFYRDLDSLVAAEIKRGSQL